MITILSDHTRQEVGERLDAKLRERKIDTDLISLADLNVDPCYSCGGCTDKTYGQCIHRDDADIILPKLMRTDVLVMVTPVKWGSYSFKTKRVFDKCAIIGDRHYYCKKGELVKGKIGRVHTFVAIGVKDQWKNDEKDAFKNLVAENIKIMNIKGSVHLVDDSNISACLESVTEDLSQ
ncbi:flavodoxin family protein [Acetobacterium sp.]|uniref:flavodoxin family protein n=1 Tax=Acetobacterium sp. TaxID=1872094 RepID=UPI00271ABFE8|nr:NAD(P)H-dependent oxidoreductase [Acetobacterium sp.]MDO9493227.1 NAD(P)H-dependent oxidoreductase [Acetobacterium sp.]